MVEFTQEGELIRDLSVLKNIPGNMTRGTAFVHDGKIWAGGSRNDWKGYWKYLVFGGAWKEI